MRAQEPVRPAYFTVETTEPERKRPEQWEEGADVVWGSVEVCLTVGPDSRLHVGSGAPRAHGDVLVAAHASVPRRRGRVLADEPVVPGSSLKGAVRVVAEALTPSCLLDRQACRGAGQVCPACMVFGAAGRRGRLGFTDAVPAPGAEAPQRAAYRIGQRYSHAHAPRRGRRLYGPHPESPVPAATEVLEVLPGGTTLQASLTFNKVPDWGLGVVTIALGLGPKGLRWLRLGAGKNRGMGIVHCAVVGGWYASTLADAAGQGRRGITDEVIARWQHAALGRFRALAGRRDEIDRKYGA